MEEKKLVNRVIELSIENVCKHDAIEVLTTAMNAINDSLKVDINLTITQYED